MYIWVVEEEIPSSSSEIRMTPEKTCILIGACAIPHNIAILRNEPMDAGFENIEDQPELTEYCGPENGKAVRDNICEMIFYNVYFMP